MPNITEIYASLIDDPDVIPPEDVSKEDYALMLAQQRVKQHANNEKALNLGLTKLLKNTNGHSTNGHTAVSAVTKLSSFVNTNNKEDLLEQALLLMLKKGVPEAFDRLFNMANQYNKKPLNPEGAGKKDSGIHDFYRQMIGIVHPDTAATRFGLTNDLVYDDEMKADMAGYNNLFQETAKHVNALSEVIDGMGNNDTIEDALRKYKESSPTAYKTMEEGLLQYFKEDGSRRSDERMNQTRNRAVRLKQIKDWADENNVDFDPNHVDLSVENDQRGREIKLDTNRINSYLRNTHRGEGDAPTWSGPSLKNTPIPKAKPKVETPQAEAPPVGGTEEQYEARRAAQQAGRARQPAAPESTRESEEEAADVRTGRTRAERAEAFDGFEERRKKADQQFDEGLLTEEDRDAEVQAAEAEYEAAAGPFPTEEEARSQPQAEREEEEVEDDPDAEEQAAADAAEEEGPEDDSDEGQERDRAYFDELTINMSGNAKEEFNRAFTDDGFKDYVKQVSDMGGNFDGIKTVTQARNHINDVASDPNHPHAAVIDNLLENDTYRQMMGLENDAFADRYEANQQPEPEAEEPVAEEPVVEEPVAEEPVEDEPVAEEEEAEEEEAVEEEEAEEEAAVEEPVAEEPVVEEPVAEEAEPEPEPEGEIDAEVGAKWDTVLDPARGGGIRHALMHGLIDTEGNITPVGKEFFDHVGGLYNDARNLINDSPDQFEAWREAQGYQRTGNPIRDDHRLSGTALNSLIGQYNRAGGRDAAGKLNQIYTMPTGVQGENLFGHEEVTPIEDAQSPSVEDMHMDQVDHKHVLNAVLRGHIRNSSHVDHVNAILEQELRDRGASPEQAAEIVGTAMATIDRSEQPEEEPSGSPSNQEAEQGQWDEFLDQASEQVHENVDQEAERTIPQLMAGPIPNEPSADQWEQQRQLPMFENLVSDEQAAKWGLAGEAYSGVDGASKLIEQYNQAGVAARAADGASADKYDIPAPKPEQAEMDIDSATESAERQAASAERAKADREAEQGQFDLPTQEELPLEEPSAEQVAQDRKDSLNTERRAKLTPEARLREDRVKDLKEVMHEDSHAHLDNPNAYTDKEIESKWKKEVRDNTAKTKEQVADEESDAVDEADEKAEEAADKRKGQAADATKNSKKGKVPSDGSNVKFNKDKALERLAKLRNPEASEDELVDKVKELNDYYDPSVGMTEKDLQTDLKAEHKLAANVASQKATAEKAKADDRTRVNAQLQLKEFQTPDEWENDKTKNPDGEKMTPEIATEHARKLLGHWHENIDALKDSEHHMAAGKILQQYIDAGADHKLLNDELKEMEAEGSIGDKDKMVDFHERRKVAKVREESEKTAHQTKLEQAIDNAHADRSTDEDGNPIHHRMDHAGDLEAVSPEDAGIEHTDSETPHLGHIGEDGNLDETAEKLYNDLHEARKQLPHDETKLKRRKADSDHHDRISQSEAARQARKDSIDSDKDAAHKRNDDSVRQGIREQVEGHFDRINQLQDDHQAELDQHDADHQATQDRVDGLVDTHARALETHATQTEAAHEAHSERTAAIASQGAKNIKGIASDALALEDEVKANRERAIASQNSQREIAETEIAADRDKKLGWIDAGQEIVKEQKQVATDTYNEQLQAITDTYNKASEDSNTALQTIVARHEAERASLAHPITGAVDDEALEKLKLEQTAELGGIRETFADATTEHESKKSELNEAHESKLSELSEAFSDMEQGRPAWHKEHDQRRQRIADAHAAAIAKHKQDAEAALGEVDSTQKQRIVDAVQQANDDTTAATTQRNKTLGEVDAAKQVVEDGHLEAINASRVERGEKPLTGKQDIQHELQQEKGVATEIHTDKLDAAIKAHGEATQAASDAHERAKQQIGADHKSTQTEINESAKSGHQENEDAHNSTVEASQGQKAQDHADVSDPLAEGEAQYAGEASKAAEQAFDDHMKAGGASEEQIARAKANPNLGKNAAGNELDHEDEGKGEHTEEEQRDGNKGQTRTVEDPESGEPKQQVWVPGRGKGWVDKDKMDSATGDNMDAAGGSPSGKMMIYPQGAEGNPFDGPMAGHGGNWHSIETDNPLASNHPDAAGHGHEDVIAHSLGNSLNAAGHDMSGDKPFEVNASDHGFGGSEHGATNKREPKEGGQFFGEQAQARATDFGAQARAAKTAADFVTGGKFTGAMDWLKQKASESGTTEKVKEWGKGQAQDFKEDVAREEASTPDIGEGLRSVRHLRERLRGGKYPSKGVLGHKPDKYGKASTKRELKRLLPKWAQSQKTKAEIGVDDYEEKTSATKKFTDSIDKYTKDYRDEQRYR